jgi:hypothetical protein
MVQTIHALHFKNSLPGFLHSTLIRHGWLVVLRNGGNSYGVPYPSWVTYFTKRDSTYVVQISMGGQVCMEQNSQNLEGT